MIKIVLVDDHKMVREGLKRFLEDNQDFEIVVEAENGRDCLDQLATVEADIVLTDLSMPQMNGLELTKILRKQFPKIKVIALTMMDDSQHIKQMLAEGVMGYLLKNCSEDDLMIAINKVYNGNTYYAPEVTNIILNSIRKVNPRRQSKVVNEMPLTVREKEVLYLILKEKTNQEIAEKLFISVRTVDAHKRNLLDKTGSRNVAGLVIFALDHELFNDI